MTSHPSARGYGQLAVAGGVVFFSVVTTGEAARALIINLHLLSLFTQWDTTKQKIVKNGGGGLMSKERGFAGSRSKMREGDGEQK